MPRPFRLLFAYAGALLAAGFVVPEAHAQRATLRGVVTDRADGQPLFGVNVVAERLGAEDDAFYGAASDPDGLYVLSRIPSGRYAVRATFLGYEPYADTLALEPGAIRQLNLALGETAEALDEVTVEAERSSGAANVTAGLQSVRAADIELVPTPDVSGDLATYLQTLPGVVSTGDRGGQLFIRGGEPTQNLVLLDGMPLYQPFHVVGFYSAFPQDVLNQADVYAGGYGSRFGGQLSSVLDIGTRTGNKRGYYAAASVAPFVTALQAEGPLAEDRVSFLASARRSVIEQGAANLVDEPLPFEFGDYFGKVHANITDSGQLSVTGIHTFDEGSVGDPASVRPDEVRWSNTALGGRFL
ncbi:MAG: TonB-dependent receptor, partial [Rhodothermales bacterium]|nr:TonB-dependent receptor [Rhodothermales bacterium]